MQSMTQLTERQVRDSAREICMLINLAHQKPVFEPVFKKYSTSKFLRVAQVPVRIKEEAQNQERMAVDQGADASQAEVWKNGWKKKRGNSELETISKSECCGIVYYESKNALTIVRWAPPDPDYFNDSNFHV